MVVSPPRTTSLIKCVFSNILASLLRALKKICTRARELFLAETFALTLHQTALDEECAFTGDNELHCEFWNEVGVFYSSGGFVKIRAGASGKVENIAVTSISKLFGLVFNRPSSMRQN